MENRLLSALKMARNVMEIKHNAYMELHSAVMAHCAGRGKADDKGYKDALSFIDDIITESEAKK